jgi:hypothetical protein
MATGLQSKSLPCAESQGIEVERMGEGKGHWRRLNNNIHCFRVGVRATIGLNRCQAYASTATYGLRSAQVEIQDVVGTLQ